ncbi:hypothetical protein ACV229_30360 [Burkholderia sp. MR1-5-21]
MYVPFFSRAAWVALIAGSAWLTAGPAIAQEGSRPEPYGQVQRMPADVNVTIGMHGDRYWDGHRYWRHDEWAHRHPHDRDPWHQDDDPRMRPHYDEPHRY